MEKPDPPTAVGNRGSRRIGLTSPSPLNVLVLPGGTEIGLEIWRSLRYCKEVRLYSAGQAVSQHADCVFKQHFVLPSVYEPDWLDRLNELIAQSEIDYIFPAHDDVLVALADNRGRIHARIVTSPSRTCQITRSKRSTYDTLRAVVPVPRVYEAQSEVDEFPVFVKPDRGQGTQRARIVGNPKYLSALVELESDLVICEYLPGEEFTVDCFSDRQSGLLFCEGRTRRRVRTGISMNSSPASSDLFRRYAAEISSQLELHGAWFFQLKRDRQGTLKLLEVGPRIAGTMALHRVLGINFPLLSIYEQERIPIEIMRNDIDLEIDRALINRYRHSLEYRTVYVDLDDTLIFRADVNTQLVRFIYQSINSGKRIVLLTRHEGPVHDVLAGARLDGLFDEVIQLDRASAKSEYIHDPLGILIDDSFTERKEVSSKVGIATFDCSMIEMLLDDRV